MRCIPVYILEQIYTHRDEYLPSEDFYQNMQRILQTDDRYVLAKDAAKELLERYIEMDSTGTMIAMLNDAIHFFQTTCCADSKAKNKP